LAEFFAFFHNNLLASGVHPGHHRTRSLARPAGRQCRIADLPVNLDVSAKSQIMIENPAGRLNFAFDF
jgi:hypothetical protein